MLKAVELSTVTAEDMVAALTGGRLRLDGNALEYTPGQYFPTKYRAAACRVLSGLLFDHHGRDVGQDDNDHSVDGYTCGGRAYAWAVRNLGRGIAGRWFTDRLSK
jgi:hypothetical protein